MKKRDESDRVLFAILLFVFTLLAPPASAADKPTPPALVAVFNDWRAFAEPERQKGIPDFSARAIARKAAGLPKLQARLATLDHTGWTARDLADGRLVEAEMNGLDFDLRVRKPWACDPDFYATIFDEESDVPAHEGTAAETLDLFKFDYPLSAEGAASLSQRLRAVPPMLEQAHAWLAGSHAADLWRYGARAFLEQADALDALLAGTLQMRTLEGLKSANLRFAGESVRADAIAARDASRAFARWIAAQAPNKSGPSGVGKENYSWYMAHVQLVPYDWDQQAALLQRELERAWASLSLEEFRNRALPELQPIEDPAAARAFSVKKMDDLTDFIIASGFVPDKPWYRAAMKAQAMDFTPLQDRNFFTHASARDPWPLYSHFIHWTELARVKNEPDPSPIRRVAPLFNIYAARSEGFATGFEELLMHAGLYKDNPGGREIVWIMLANRAARGLASLRVHANEISLAEAGQFHSKWTPRHWADSSSKLVGFEQLLYLRMPGYGTSYIVGKALLDRLIAERAHAATLRGESVEVPKIFAAIASEGVIPWSLMGAEDAGEEKAQKSKPAQ